jgi:hypothetical protein
MVVAENNKGEKVEFEGDYMILLLGQIKSIRNIGVTYDCDFIYRLQSYFTGGVYRDIKLYLLFYKE